MIHRMTAALLSLTGLFISAYLYLYKIGKIGSLACGTGGCETVQWSPWSRVAGIEVSLVGLLGYASLLVLCLAALQPNMVHRREPALLLAALSGIAVLFTIVSHLPGAIRHSRHLPLVRSVRRGHRGNLHSISLRSAPAAPGPDLVRVH